MSYHIWKKKANNNHQLLWFRQTGIGHARSLGVRIVRNMFTANTAVTGLYNTSIKASQCVHNSHYLCYIYKVRQSSYLCIRKLLPSKNVDIGPITYSNITALGPGEQIKSIIILDGASPFFSEVVPPEDYLPSVILLKSSSLYRFSADTGKLMMRCSLACMVGKVNTYDMNEERDTLVIVSHKCVTKDIFGGTSSVRIHFAIFNLHPFSIHCWFSVSDKSFKNPDISRYGVITAASSFDSYQNFISVSTSKSYTLLFSYDKFVDSLTPGVTNCVSCSSLDCLLVIPGNFPYMSVECHSRDLTMLCGMEPHSMHVLRVSRLANYSPAECFSKESGSTKKDCGKEIMLKSCGEAVKSEENNCDYVCSCSVDFLPGDMNRLFIRETGTLRIYSLPLREDGDESPLLNNLLLRCQNTEIRMITVAERPSRDRNVPPRYCRSREDDTFYCSFSHEYNLLLILVLWKACGDTNIKSLLIYDGHDLKLLRTIPIDICFKTGEFPNNATISFCNGIILIEIIHDQYSRILVFNLGSFRDDGGQVDLQAIESTLCERSR